MPNIATTVDVDDLVGVALAEFCSTVPFKARSPRGRAFGGQRRILLAEDDPIQGQIIRRSLQQKGYEVDLVEDGLEAVALTRDNLYHLALFDFSMPEMDGFTTARVLQRLLVDEVRPRMVAYTALPEAVMFKERESGNMPFDAVITKARGLPALMDGIAAQMALVQDR